MAPVPFYLEVGRFKKFVRNTEKGGALIFFFLIDSVTTFLMHNRRRFWSILPFLAELLSFVFIVLETYFVVFVDRTFLLETCFLRKFLQNLSHITASRQKLIGYVGFHF